MSVFKDKLVKATAKVQKEREEKSREYARQRTAGIEQRFDEYKKSGRLEYMKGEAMGRGIPFELEEQAKAGKESFAFGFSDLTHGVREGFLATAQEILQELELDFVVDWENNQVRTWWGSKDPGFHRWNSKNALLLKDGRNVRATVIR